MDAFTRLFEPIRPVVFAAAARMVGIDRAEDVVMDTYLKAWQGLPRFRGGSSLGTWTFRIARNCSLDMIRRERRFESVDAAGDDGPNRLANIADEREATPDEAVARDEVAARVQRAMAKLPDEHRVALRLRYSDGLQYSEIAAATGVAIGTVMSRLFNGKRKLMKLLGEEGKE